MGKIMGSVASFFSNIDPLTLVGCILLFFGTAFTIAGQQRLSNKSSDILEQKNNEIIALNQEIRNTVTGGDSFCYLLPKIAMGYVNRIEFSLKLKGDYPAYDVTVKIFDLTCHKKMQIEYVDNFGKKYKGPKRYKNLTDEDVIAILNNPDLKADTMETEKRMKESFDKCSILSQIVGTVHPMKSMNVNDTAILTFTLPDKFDPENFVQEYSVQILARNGSYHQNINISIKNKNFLVHSKVTKTIDPKKEEVVREYELYNTHQYQLRNII